MPANENPKMVLCSSLSSDDNRATHMKAVNRRCPALLLALAWSAISVQPAEVATHALRHSYLVMGSKTAIIAEDGTSTWEHTGGSRDGFVLPGGNVLLAYSDRVEEVTRDKHVVFTYKRSRE